MLFDISTFRRPPVMGIKQIIGIASGALVGFLIGYFGRCVGQTS